MQNSASTIVMIVRPQCDVDMKKFFCVQEYSAKPITDCIVLYVLCWLHIKSAAYGLLYENAVGTGKKKYDGQQLVRSP